MLLRCPACDARFLSDGIRPLAGTAVCAEHGEVRPKVQHPVLDEPAGTPDRWTATWSQIGSAYCYEATLDLAFKRPFGWKETVGTGAGALEGAAYLVELGVNAIPLVALAAPALALGYLERKTPGRIRIDRDRVLIGGLHWWHENIGALTVERDRGGGSSLVATRFVQVVLSTPKLPEELGPLCHELNEALLVVRHCEPPPAKRTPYRD